MERGIVSAVNGRRARVKRPDGYVTGWLFLADAVLSANAGDIVFYEPFGNDGLILHVVGADFVEYAPAQHDHDSSYLKLIGGTLAGGLDVGGYDLQNSLLITGSNGNAYETYPRGFSHATINVDNYAQDSGENFPKQYGTLLTVNQERTRMFQLLFNTAASEIFTRSYVYTSGFSPWRHLTSPRLLWGPGSWSNGELTVPDSSKYSVFIVATDFVSMFVHKLSATELIGIGGSCRTADQYIAALSASYSENIWTWGSIKRMYHKESTTHDSLVDITVTNIYGIA